MHFQSPKIKSSHDGDRPYAYYYDQIINEKIIVMSFHIVEIHGYAPDKPIFTFQRDDALVRCSFS